MVEITKPIMVCLCTLRTPPQQTLPQELLRVEGSATQGLPHLVVQIGRGDGSRVACQDGLLAAFQERSGIDRSWKKVSEKAHPFRQARHWRTCRLRS